MFEKMTKIQKYNTRKFVRFLEYVMLTNACSDNIIIIQTVVRNKCSVHVTNSLFIKMLKHLRLKDNHGGDIL